MGEPTRRDVWKAGAGAFAAAGLGSAAEPASSPQPPPTAPSASARSAAGLTLWCRQPAGAPGEREGGWGWYNYRAWLQALPLGNGRLGAMVFGGVAEERLEYRIVAGHQP